MQRSRSRHARSWSRTTGFSSLAGRRRWENPGPSGPGTARGSRSGCTGPTATRRSLANPARRAASIRRSGTPTPIRRSRRSSRCCRAARISSTTTTSCPSPRARSPGPATSAPKCSRCPSVARSGSSASAVRCTGPATTIRPTRDGAGRGSTSRSNPTTKRWWSTAWSTGAKTITSSSPPRTTCRGTPRS